MGPIDRFSPLGWLALGALAIAMAATFALVGGAWTVLQFVVVAALAVSGISLLAQAWRAHTADRST